MQLYNTMPLLFYKSFEFKLYNFSFSACCIRKCAIHRHILLYSTQILLAYNRFIAVYTLYNQMAIYIEQ